MTEFRLLASRKTFVGLVMGLIILCIFYLSFHIDNFHHGTGLLVFGQQQDQKKALAENYTFERSWGSKGAGSGQFMNPHSLAIDRFGNVYITDTGNNRVEKFASNGTLLGMWGSKGNMDGHFNQLHDIAVDPSGNFVYTVELANHRVQKFDDNGNFITKWGSVIPTAREPIGNPTNWP
jgi:NHL repeat